MSKISLEPNDSGAGTFSIVSPDSNTNRTLNLPDESGILFSDGSGVPGSAVTGQLASSNMPAGSVIQVVGNTTSTIVSTTSSSFISTGLSANITPKMPNSKILVIVSQPIYIERTSEFGSILDYRIVRNSTEIYRPGFGETGQVIRNATEVESSIILSPSVLDSVSVTNEITYTVEFNCRVSSRGGGVSAQTDTQQNNLESSITLMEIAG